MQTRFGLTVLWLAAALTAGGAEPTASATLSNGARVLMRTFLEPGGRSPEALRLDSGIRVRASSISRYVLDGRTGTYFGYDLEIEVLRALRSFRVTLKPLSIVPPAPAGGRLSMAPVPVRSPDPILLQDGETLGIDLLTNPASGEKLVDKVSMSLGDDMLKLPTGAAGGVNLRLVNPTVSMNGKRLGRVQPLDLQGPIVWMTVPSVGRVFVTAAEAPASLPAGVRKAGYARGSRMIFALDGNVFEVLSQQPIVQDDREMVVGALLDPSGAAPDLLMGSTQSIDYLTPVRR